MWVARDKGGSLYAYDSKPIKEESEWVKASDDKEYYCIDESLFPEVKWEDPEPTEVEIIIKKK